MHSETGTRFEERLPPGGQLVMKQVDTSEITTARTKNRNASLFPKDMFPLASDTMCVENRDLVVYAPMHGILAPFYSLACTAEEQVSLNP